jgi:hypothetical protein
MSANEDSRPDDFPAELKPFEAALGSLAPAGSRIDRDRLMYLAGAASATYAVSAAAAVGAAAQEPNRRSRSRSVFWPCAAAAMLLVSLGLGALVALRGPAERVVYVDRPVVNQESSAAPSVTAPAGDSETRFAASQGSADASYLVLREHVLRLGVNALDAPSPEVGGSHRTDTRNRALLNQLLGS